MIIGIDPGLNGGIAAISPLEYEVYDIPTLEIITGRVRNKKTGLMRDKKQNRYNIAAIIKILTLLKGAADKLNYPVEVWVENVHAMPDQGVTSMFNMGVGFGILQTIPICLGIPLNFVSPVTWKKKIMEGQGKRKDAAVYRAQQLFPNAELVTPRGRKLDGRAEALLIAHYGNLSNTNT